MDYDIQIMYFKPRRILWKMSTSFHNLSRMSFEVPYNLTTNVDNVRHGVDEYVLF